MPSYRRLQQYALAISVVSVIYNGAEGGISIGFGAEASSRSLVFFGIQSGIEVASALMVLWRFSSIAKPGEERTRVLGERELRIEKIASGGIGILLLALALGAEVSAIVALALHQEPDASNASIIISASALAIMIAIWLPKRYLARALNSSAMQGEATCSLSCIQITIVLFAGSLIFRLWHGGWWVDSATTLFLGILFGWEGWKMIRWVRNPAFDGGCCDCGSKTRTDPLAATELGEQYRDLCECCQQKEECKESGECKCTDIECTESKCCKPSSADGSKCCTHKIIQGHPNPCVTSCCERDAPVTSNTGGETLPNSGCGVTPCGTTCKGPVSDANAADSCCGGEGEVGGCTCSV